MYFSQTSYEPKPKAKSNYALLDRDEPLEINSICSIDWMLEWEDDLLLFPKQSIVYFFFSSIWAWLAPPLVIYDVFQTISNALQLVLSPAQCMFNF